LLRGEKGICNNNYICILLHATDKLYAIFLFGKTKMRIIHNKERNFLTRFIKRKEILFPDFGG